MKLGVLWLMVVAAGTAKGALSPTGKHVCLFDEKYVDVIQVEEFVPVTVYKVEWCWGIPPRCTVTKREKKRTLVSKKVPRVRVVPKCCSGYREVVEGSKCVPVCTEPCLNGECTAPEECSCESGYSGNRCEKPCEPGTWGKRCSEECDCHNNATCDGVNGQCFCTPGWQGLRCDSPCEPGFYGANCEGRCECGGYVCHHESGMCETTTEPPTTTTDSTSSETTTETRDLTHSTEGAVTESSTSADANEAEHSTVGDQPNGTNDLMRVRFEEENTDLPYEANETAKDNEIEHSQDLMGVQVRKFSLFNILENLSIICGIFLLIFVVTMGSVMVSHCRKIRKTGYECNAKNNNSNTESLTLHRFYGGSILPSKTILDNQVCATNVDLRVEQPILMTFKPLPDEKSKAECIITSIESNAIGNFDSCRDSAPGRQIVQVRCGEPRSMAYISTRCKSV